MIHSEKQGFVRILRIEHGKANAIDCDLLHRLLEVIDQAEAEAGPVVLTGTGGIFSAGLDLPRFLEGGSDYVAELLPLLTLGLRRLFALPKPVIAAVNGHAIAGGCILVCACDYRIAAAGPARIGVPELKVGVPFPTAAMEIISAVVPGRYVQEVFYSGATYPLAEAIERGLLDEVVAPEDLLARACEVAEAYGAIAPVSYAVTKRQIRQGVMDRIATGVETVDPELAEIWKAPETHAAIREYVKRTL